MANARSIQIHFKHEKTYSPSSKTPIRPKVDPKTSKISVANETSALDPIEPWIKLSIERSTLQSNHIGLYRLADIKPLGQQTNLYSSYKSLKHADRAQPTILQVLRNLSEAAIILFPPLKPSFSLGASTTASRQQWKANLTIAAINPFNSSLISNAANIIQASAPIWGGNTSSGVASGMRSVETHVHLSFGWTHEELWLRVSRKSVVAVPMEPAPRARSRRVRGLSTFDRMRQPQTNFIYFIRRKLLERNSFIPISSVHRSFELPLVPLISNRNSSTSNFLFTDYLRAMHRWTQIIIT